MKRMLGKILSAVLAICLLMAMVPFTAFAEDPETQENNSYRFRTSDGKTAVAAYRVVKNTSLRKVSIDLTELTANSKKYIAGTFSIHADNGSQTSFVDIKSQRGSAIVAFDYLPKLGAGGGSIVINALDTTTGEPTENRIEVTEPGTFMIRQDSSTWFRIYLTSGSQSGAETSLEVSNFRNIASTTSVTVTINAADGGYVAADGKNIGFTDFGGTVTQASITGLILNGFQMAAYPAAGYDFLGFVDSNNKKLSLEDDKLYPTENIEVTPIFAKQGETPAFVVGNQLFTDLGAAAAAAADGGVVIPLWDCVVPAGTYNFPSGATLLIPNDDSNTVYTETPPLYNSGNQPSVTPTAYRKLTLANGAVLNFADGAAMSVGGKLFSAGGGKSCCVTDTYGQVIIQNGARINFESGSNLYVWGFITDDVYEDPDEVTENTHEYDNPDEIRNKIHIKDGATVYEMFQICDFPGGTITMNMILASDVYFPLSQYYIQNVECRMRIDAGAREEIYGALVALSMNHSASMVFIGPDSNDAKKKPLFKLTDGHIVKYYDAAPDKVKCDIWGEATISPVKVTISGKAIDTTERQMPINNIGVNVKSGGVLNTDQAIVLLPDSSINVEEGAEFNINKGVYLVDSEDWIYDPSSGDTSSHVYPRGSNLRPNMFSATRYDIDEKNYSEDPDNYDPPTGKSPRQQNGGAGSMDDAQLVVGGTVNIGVNGTLATTEGGADIQGSSTGAINYPPNYENNAPALIMGSFTNSSTTTTVVPDNDIEQEFAYNPETGKWDVVFTNFKGFSLSPYGDIFVNIYFIIEEGTDINDYRVTINEKEYTFNASTTDSSRYIVWTETQQKYRVTYPVKIAELTQNLNAKLYYTGENAPRDNVNYIAAEYGINNDNLKFNPTPLTQAELENYTVEIIDEEEVETPNYYFFGTVNGVEGYYLMTHALKQDEDEDNKELSLENISLSAGDTFHIFCPSTDTVYSYDGGDYSVANTSIYTIVFNPDADLSKQRWSHGNFYVKEDDNEDIKGRYMLGTLVQSMYNFSSQAYNYADENDWSWLLQKEDCEAPYTTKYIESVLDFGDVTSQMVIDKLGGTTTTVPEADFLSQYGLEYQGSSLVLNDDTKLRHYFIIRNAAKYNTVKDSFTFDGAAAQAHEVSGMIYFEKSNIASPNLDVRYVLANSNGTASISYAALDYAQKRIADTTEVPKLVNLMKALYWYNVYSDAYFDFVNS